MRHQAARRVWEYPRSTRRRAERYEQLINPYATDVIPAIPSAVEDPKPAGGETTMQQRATQPGTVQHARQFVGTRRGAEDNQVLSSAKRSHTPPPPLSEILPQPHVEMETGSTPGDEMEVNALCEERIDQPDMEAFFDTAGEFYDHCSNLGSGCDNCWNQS